MRHRQLPIVIALLVFTACESFIQVDAPPGALSGATVFHDDRSATSTIIGIYTSMMSTDGFASGGATSITVTSGLSADEFKAHSGLLMDFEANNLLPTNSLVLHSLWEPGYKYIYYANSVLEGLSKSNQVSEPVKNQLEGEAKFLRAFCYFYLTNLFGDVPLVTGTNYRINTTLSRAPQYKVYEQIIADLLDARELLPIDYSVYGGERIRPNKGAATALLARVYLYRKEWEKAEAEAITVIDDVLYSLENDLDAVFLRESREAIWQLMPVVPGYNTFEGPVFIPGGVPHLVSLTTESVDAFEAGDVRRVKWVGEIDVAGQRYYYPHKYKKGYDPKETEEVIVTEYSMVLRLAEQFLIRAEARARQDRLTEAIADLDKIKQRAGLPLVSETNPQISRQDLLLQIEKERQLEFISEWGHRWFDLKRTGRAGTVLQPFKSEWQITDQYYPIPQQEIDNNPNLQPQNPGY